MKKICAMFLLFLISFVFVGCDSGSAYYFLFKNDSINCEVGDTISIFELESSTNIANYEHMHIYTDDSKVAEINNSNFSVKLLKEGCVTVFVSGNYSNKFVSDSIILNVVSGSLELGGEDLDNNDETSGKDESGDENINDGCLLSYEIIDENIIGSNKVVCCSVLLDSSNFVNYEYKVTNFTDSNYQICAYGCMIEVVYKVGSEVEIEITNKNNKLDKVILKLS